MTRRLWHQNYVITTPVDGIVTFNSYWAENQNINIGEIVMSVVPADSMQTFVRVQFPMRNAGKVYVLLKSLLMIIACYYDYSIR